MTRDKIISVLELMAKLEELNKKRHETMEELKEALLLRYLFPELDSAMRYSWRVNKRNDFFTHKNDAIIVSIDGVEREIKISALEDFVLQNMPKLRPYFIERERKRKLEEYAHEVKLAAESYDASV